MTDDRENRAGQDIDGFPRPTMPFVGQTKGERRLRTLSFCVFKLRNFDSVHRDNATISVCVGGLYPSYCHI